jgi:hypothetical protein
MPYTVYKKGWAERNSILDHDITHNRTYRYAQAADTAVAFGTGLSLTKFTLKFNASEKDGESLPTSGAANTSFSIVVTNTGSLQGDEVVMAYFMPIDVALPLHPRKALFDFQRLHDIAPGASTTVTFAVGPDSLLLATSDGDLVRAPGKYTIVFENGGGESLAAPLQLTGKQVVVEPFPRP